MIKIQVLLGSLLILLVGCNNSSPEPSSSPITSETTLPSPSPVAESPTQSQSTTISPDGIGAAKVGMTLGELKQALGSSAEFQVESPFIVDFDAIAVSQAGEVQYYILYPQGTTLSDSDSIEILLTENPQYRTAEGVGPETELQQAEAAYGKPTLSYNYGSEGREVVNFANQPTKDYLFNLGNANAGNLAGIYPSSQGEYNETSEYKPDAKINSVLVR